MDIDATIHQPHRQNMSYYTSERGMMAVTPRSEGAYRSDSDESTSRDWKAHAFNLEREIRQLRDTVETLRAQTEMHRLDVIARSQRRVECDHELYKRIGDYTKQTLFRHIKFITSDAMLNDLASKTSLANITMDHFGIDVRDRISWWRACSCAVSDAISNHRNQVTQAIKAQVLSKLIMKCHFSMNRNSPLTLSYNGRWNVIEFKAKATEIVLAGNQVPDHIKLPELEDILKMRPPPTPNTRGEETDHQDDSMTTFTFVVEHLVGAILGKKVWDKYKCHQHVSTKFTPSDEAYLYVTLLNSYELWMSAEGSRVGTGSLTKDGTNKKYCGWTVEGIRKYNEYMEKVKTNRKAVGARDVEEAVMNALKERYEKETRRNTIAVRRRRRKRRHHNLLDSDDSDEERALGEIDAHNDLSTAFTV